MTIQGTAPVIETETSSIAAVRTSKDLNDLPLNIRSTVSGTGDSGLYRYVFLTPTGGQGGGSRFSLGGARGTQNYFNVDGITSNSPAFGNSIGPAEPSFESIQEVRFEIVNNKAEFGEVANITAITKSGTNRTARRLVLVSRKLRTQRAAFLRHHKGAEHPQQFRRHPAAGRSSATSCFSSVHMKASGSARLPSSRRTFPPRQCAAATSRQFRT